MAFPAHADIHDNFNSSLAGLPGTVFQAEAPSSFVNLHAIATVFSVLNVTPAMFERGNLAAEVPVFRAALTTEPARFEAATGIQPHELEFLAIYGQRPQQAIIWGVEQDARARLAAKLPDAGFVVHDEAQQSYANGELGRLNLGAVDASSPWLGAMGEASLVKSTDYLLYQAQSEPALQAVLAQPSAFDTVPGKALAETYGSGPEPVTQAMFFSAAFGVAAGGRSAHGLQPYLGAMLADVQGEHGPKAVLALVYPDCSQAAQARAFIESRWNIQSSARPVYALVETSAACLATVVVEDAQPRLARNVGFASIYAAMLQRAFLPMLAN